MRCHAGLAVQELARHAGFQVAKTANQVRYEKKGKILWRQRSE